MYIPRNVNPAWVRNRVEDIKQDRIINETLSSKASSQTLISLLSKYNKPFKVYNLGAGVRRITTETTICPYCKKKL